MRKKMRLLTSLLALLGSFVLVASACGSSDDSSDSGGGALTMAIVAPSASDDLAFSQSMVDSVNALDREITLRLCRHNGMEFLPFLLPFCNRCALGQMPEWLLEHQPAFIAKSKF